MKCLLPERIVRERDSSRGHFLVAMMKRNHTRPYASAAIAAALALSPTSLLAQVADFPTSVVPQPAPVIPETTTLPPGQPTIVVPEIEAAPTATTAPEPAASTSARTERAASPSARTAPAPRVRTASPADPAPLAAQPEPAPLATEPVAQTTTVAPIAAPVADTIDEPTTAEDPSSGALLMGLAVIAAIAALVLALWGFVAIGRRKPVDRKAAELIERPVVARQPLVTEPAAAEPIQVERAQMTPTPIHAPAPSLAHTGASIPLPRTIPATFEDRNALINRMVAAKPDRANPFTSPIQRRKRAKLILQSLGHDFGEREPWIDLSQYPQNWPELARRQAAA
jgi:hypothetical protein